MSSNQDEIVISGIGGFFPKSSNLEQFKKSLLSNEILLETRWKEGERGVSNRIGTCPSIQYFDTAFFGIHRQQATFMDPMQRLILERTFEALVDAGVNPQDIKGKRIGVYMGSSIGENDNLFYESIVSGFGVTGHSRAMMPNRISYWLNLKGPSCAYDSNWINGIEVLQMGFDAVREGHCEAAIIGTANLALNSEISWLYNDMGVLSPDGTTKAFDADASGYARSDGIIVMYIQRAVEAKRAYATIVGTSAMFNGARDGPLLDLDQPSMIRFMEDFYKKCQVDPNDVDLVECYGCAIKATDEAELNAIDAVYCKNRKSPLLIGSVKTNTGHAEASANLMSIAKVLVAMETGKIPATLQYNKPNPNIPGLVEGRLKVVTENCDWNGQYAAINGIGLSSSYAHCLLKANPKIKNLETVDDLPRLIVSSTRTESGIEEILNTIKDQPTYDIEYLALIQELYRKPIQGHLYRGYSILDKDGERKREFEYHAGNKRQTWFIFSGMGSQWTGMGRDLLKLPIFAETILKCHRVLEPHGVDLIKIITSDDPTMFDNILHSFVGIAAIQIGLTDVLRALGLVPDGIIGHSVGELACAYADDCLTAEQMVLCAYSRGKASQEAELISGMMAAVGLGYDKIKNQLPETIEVACHNSADSSTISGPKEDMEIFVKDLQDRGIFARLVNVSNIAYHSRYIKPAAPFLLKYLKELIPVPTARSSKWISTSVDETEWGGDLAATSSAEYHTNNLLSSVLFEEGSRHIPKDSVCIEIAPHGLLQAILKKSLKSGCTNIPLTQRGSKDGLEFLLGAIGRMYLAGLDVNVARIYPQIEYPVSKGTIGLSPLVHWEHGERWRTGIEDKLNYLISVKDQQISITDPEFKDCIGHQLDDRIILPLSSFLNILMRILAASKSIEITNVIFENLRFRNVIQIPKVGGAHFYGMIQKGTGEFEVISGDDIILTGKVSVPQPTDKFMMNTFDLGTATDILTATEVYQEFGHRGHKYDGTYKLIDNLTFTEEGSIASLTGDLTWENYLEAMVQQFFFKQGEKYQNTLSVNIIQRINIAIPEIPEKAEDVKLEFDYSTRISSMKGLQLIGMEAAPLPTTPKAISYDSLEFVPYEGGIYNNLESIINYSIMMTINNFPDIFGNNIVITEIVNKRPSIVKEIKNVMEKYTQLNMNITSTTNPKLVIVSHADPILVISDDEVQEITVKSITPPDIFILTRNSKDLLSSYNDVIVVAEFNLESVKYTLFRKAENLPVKMKEIPSNITTPKGLLQFLNPKLQEKIFALINFMPREGVDNFARQIHSDPKLKNIKLIFSIGPNVKVINVNDTIIKDIVRRNNVLSVVKGGAAGTILPLSTCFKVNTENDVQMSSLYFKANYDNGNSKEDVKLSYIGINSNDESINSKIYGLGNIDYSGKTNDTSIMGLAKFDKETFTLTYDDILKWEVPKDWNLEDAATVPHAYITAYHCLIQKGRLEHGETVLVHSGCSAIGLAAISIATSFGCNIFATVATDWQKAFLKKHFPNLRDRNVLNSEDTTFEPYILTATGGVGAHLILNTQTGSQLNATVRCLAEYGRLIQLGKLDRKQNNTIGMSVFLKNTSATGTNPEVIFSLPVEEKIELKKLIQTGIEKYIVRPLYRKVVDHQETGSILKSLNRNSHIGKILVKLTSGLDLNQLNLDKHNQFICTPKCTHLIYGGTSGSAIDVIEWLVMRGAKHVMVCTEIMHNRRLELLKKYFGCKIYKPEVSGSEMFSGLYGIGPIQTVFVLPGRDVEVESIEAALRNVAPKALFINFLSCVSGICEVRSTSGFPSYNVQWDKELEFNDVLFGLDDILSIRAANVFVKSDRISDVEQETAQALYKKLALMFLNTPNDVINEDSYFSKEVELIQLPSSGPKRIRELPPVVLVPGYFGIEHLKNLAKKLLYPIFYTQLPLEPLTIEEAGKLFADKIRKLYTRGPYNIIGISAGGCLAIEIAKHLQEFSNTQVSLIDGAPDTLQATLKCLGDGTNFEVNLLNRVLNINNNEVLQQLTSKPNWTERLSSVLDINEITDEHKRILTNQLNLLKQNLDQIINFQPPTNPLKGEIFLYRPLGSSKTDNCGLTKYCTQLPKINVSTGDHLTILKTDATIDLLNENVTVV